MKGAYASSGRVRVAHVGAVAVLTLERPGTRNALGVRLVEELARRLAGLAADRSVRAVVLEGAGGHFAASPAPGHCLAALREGPANARRFAALAPTPREMATSNRLAALRSVARFPKPLIAAVRGEATGEGCALALACDLLVAASDARLCFPETGLGVIPGSGGTQSLARRAGRQRALELLWTGRTFSGREAAAWGLALCAVPAGRVRAEALALARRIARRPPLAVAAAKAAVDAALGSGAAGVAAERKLFARLFASADAAEAMAALLESRRPRFTGR